MKFSVQAFDAYADGHHNPIYQTHSSSSYTVREGYPNKNYDGSRVAAGIFSGHLEMREATQREIEKEMMREEIIAKEIEKEMMREEIIAKEIERRRILENEVRDELMMERRMAMGRGGGFCSVVMPPLLPPNPYEQRSIYKQPIGLEERLIMSIDERYSHRCETRGFRVSPFQRLGDLPNIKQINSPLPVDNKKEGKGDVKSISGTKRRSTAAVCQGTTDNSKKKVKAEWSCAICQVSATSEGGLNQHLQGKKHQANEANLLAHKTGSNFGLGVTHEKPTVNPTSSEQKKAQITSNSVTSDSNKVANKRCKFRFWCELCQVGVPSEKSMNNHKEGKKHLAKLYRKGQLESEKTCDIVEEIKMETKKTVVAEVRRMETGTFIQVVETVEDDNKMKTGVGEDASV